MCGVKPVDLGFDGCADWSSGIGKSTAWNRLAAVCRNLARGGRGRLCEGDAARENWKHCQYDQGSL